MKREVKNIVGILLCVFVYILILFLPVSLNNTPKNTESTNIQNTKFINSLDNVSIFDYEIISSDDVLLKEANIWDEAKDIFIPREIIVQNKYYSVKGIADYGFIMNAHHIKSITFEYNKNFSYIGQNSFENLNLITKKEIELPLSTEHIGKDAFKNSQTLEKINISSLSNLKTIEDYAFANCTNLVSSVVLGNDINYIGFAAFVNDEKISDVDLGHCVNLKKINSFSFYNCSKNIFHKLILNDNIQEIGEKAFANTVFQEIFFDFSLSTINKISFGIDWKPFITKKVFFPYTTVDLFLLKTNFNFANEKDLFVDGLPITFLDFQPLSNEIIFDIPWNIDIVTNYGVNPCFKINVISSKNIDLEVKENIYSKNYTLILKKWYLFSDNKLSISIQSIINTKNSSTAEIIIEKQFKSYLFGRNADNIFISTGLVLIALNSLLLTTISYLLIEKKLQKKQLIQEK